MSGSHSLNSVRNPPNDSQGHPQEANQSQGGNPLGGISSEGGERSQGEANNSSNKRSNHNGHPSSNPGSTSASNNVPHIAHLIQSANQQHEAHQQQLQQQLHQQQAQLLHEQLQQQHQQLQQMHHLPPPTSSSTHMAAVAHHQLPPSAHPPRPNLHHAQNQASQMQQQMIDAGREGDLQNAEAFVTAVRVFRPGDSASTNAASASAAASQYYHPETLATLPESQPYFSNVPPMGHLPSHGMPSHNLPNSISTIINMPPMMNNMDPLAAANMMMFQQMQQMQQQQQLQQHQQQQIQQHQQQIQQQQIQQQQQQQQADDGKKTKKRGRGKQRAIAEEPEEPINADNGNPDEVELVSTDEPQKKRTRKKKAAASSSIAAESSFSGSKYYYSLERLTQEDRTPMISTRITEQETDQVLQGVSMNDDEPLTDGGDMEDYENVDPRLEQMLGDSDSLDPNRIPSLFTNWPKTQQSIPANPQIRKLSVEPELMPILAMIIESRDDPYIFHELMSNGHLLDQVTNLSLEQLQVFSKNVFQWIFHIVAYGVKEDLNVLQNCFKMLRHVIMAQHPAVRHPVAAHEHWQPPVRKNWDDYPPVPKKTFYIEYQKFMDILTFYGLLPEFKSTKSTHTRHSEKALKKEEEGGGGEVKPKRRRRGRFRDLPDGSMPFPSRNLVYVLHLMTISIAARPSCFELSIMKSVFLLFLKIRMDENMAISPFTYDLELCMITLLDLFPLRLLQEQFEDIALQLVKSFDKYPGAIVKLLQDFPSSERCNHVKQLIALNLVEILFPGTFQGPARRQSVKTFAQAGKKVNNRYRGVAEEIVRESGLEHLQTALSKIKVDDNTDYAHLYWFAATANCCLGPDELLKAEPLLADVLKLIRDIYFSISDPAGRFLERTIVKHLFHTLQMRLSL